MILTHMDQKSKIAEYLSENGSGTVRDFVIYLNINSPTKRVSEMIRMGYPIEKEKVEKINSRGERKWFIRYIWKGERK